MVPRGDTNIVDIEVPRSTTVGELKELLAWFVNPGMDNERVRLRRTFTNDSPGALFYEENIRLMDCGVHSMQRVILEDGPAPCLGLMEVQVILPPSRLSLDGCGQVWRPWCCFAIHSGEPLQFREWSDGEFTGKVVVDWIKQLATIKEVYALL